VAGHVSEQRSDGGEDRCYHCDAAGERIVAVLRAVLDFVIVRAVDLEFF